MEEKNKGKRSLGIRIMNSIFSLIFVWSLVIIYFSSYSTAAIVFIIFSAAGLIATSFSTKEGVWGIAMAVVVAFFEGIALVVTAIASIFSAFG